MSVAMWDLHRLERYERMEQRKADKEKARLAREAEDALLRKLTAVTPVYNPLLDIPKHLPLWKAILAKIRKLPIRPLTHFRIISPLPGMAPQPVTPQQEAKWTQERERRDDDAQWEKLYLLGAIDADTYTLLLFQHRT